MKKVSRSILPNSHKKVNTLPRAEKTVLKGFWEQEQRDIISALSDILQKYRQCEEDTESGRNEKLVHYITDRFQELLKPYVDNFAKTVDLQLAVREIAKSKRLQDNVADEVFKSIKSSIRKLKKESSKTTNLIDTKDSPDTSLDEAMSQLEDQKNFPTRFRKEIERTQGKHTSEIVELFRKNCKDYAKKSGGKRARSSIVASGQRNILENMRKRQLGIFKKNAQQRAAGMTPKLIKRQLGIFKKNAQQGESIGGIRSIQNIFKIGSFIKKVASISVSVIVKILSGIVGGIVKGIRKLGGVLVSTLKFFRIDKLLSGVVNIVGDIFKLAKKAVQNSFCAVIRTPAGMFAIGYALGYVWGLVKKNIDKNHEGGVVGWMKKTFEPQIIWFNGVVEKTKGVFDTIYLDYIKPFVDFIKPIATKTSDIVGTMLGFVLQHPVLVTSILALLKIVPPLLQILGPASKVLKCCGSPLSALIAAGILASAFVVPRLFSYVFGKNKFQLANEKSEIASGVGSANKINIEGLSQEEKKKYDALTSQMNVEESELGQLVNDINNLRDVFENDDDKNTNLNALYGDFVRTVYDSELFGFDRAEYNNFRKRSKNSSVIDQLKMLADAVSKRYNRLIIMKNALATSVSSKHLQYMIDRIAKFDGGNVVASDVVKKLQIDTKDLRKDRWFMPWHDLQDKLRKYTDIVGNVQSKKTTRYQVNKYNGRIRRRMNGKDPNKAFSIERIVPTQVVSEKQIKKLVGGLDDNESEIVRNTMLSKYNSEDIDRLKKMSLSDRKRVFDKMIAEWKERNKRISEERKKEDEKKRMEEITRLDEESRKLEKQNKKMREMISQRTGKRVESK